MSKIDLHTDVLYTNLNQTILFQDNVSPSEVCKIERKGSTL